MGYIRFVAATSESTKRTTGVSGEVTGEFFNFCVTFNTFVNVTARPAIKQENSPLML